MSKDGYRLLAGNVNTKISRPGAVNKSLAIKSISPANFVYLVVFFDIVTILTISYGVSSIAASSTGAAPNLNFFGVCLFMLILLFLFERNHLYKIEKIESFQKSWTSISGIWIFALFITAMVALLTGTRSPAEISVYAGFLITGLLGSLGERLLLSRLFQHCVKEGIVSQEVVAIGSTALAQKLANHIKSNRFGVRVGAIFDDGWIENHINSDVTLSPGVGLDALVQYYKANHVDAIVIALPSDDSERLRYLIKHLIMYPVNIRILPGEIALTAETGRYAHIGDIPGVQLMTVSNRPIDSWGLFAKFLMDRTIGTFALIFFGPIMLGCAIGIKLSSPGPVLFRQKRIGCRNEIFEVYKFRSMHVNGCNTGRLTERCDPRLFKFGQIMRKLSLDELPQIFNVLLGDMSLVGPRPHMPEARAAGLFYFDAVADYASRHRVKPGITGWAQINGWRGPTETIEQIKNRVAHDLYYIDNWSLGLDFLILVKTVFVGFFGKNAF